MYTLSLRKYLDLRDGTRILQQVSIFMLDSSVFWCSGKFTSLPVYLTHRLHSFSASSILQAMGAQESSRSAFI